MMKKNSMLKSFQYAFAGILDTIRQERNMKIHLVVMCLVIVLGIFLKISRTEWFVCILLFGAVLAAEAFNTAIEAVVDMTMPEKNALAKKAKDAAAGGVLIFAIAAAIIGIWIFLPKLLRFVGWI